MNGKMERSGPGLIKVLPCFLHEGIRKENFEFSCELRAAVRYDADTYWKSKQIEF
jgi:hypothetical protein